MTVLLLGHKKAGLFLKELSNSAGFVKFISRNPYYLTSLAVVFDVTNLLPQDNPTLANLLIDLLLKRFSLNNPNVDISSINEKLAILAWNMLNEGIAGSWVTILQMKHSCKRFNDEWTNLNINEIPQIIDIGCSSGIFKSYPGKNQICFYHQLLQEQLASMHLQKILFSGDEWRSDLSSSMVSRMVITTKMTGFDFASHFSSVLMNLASRLSEKQLILLMAMLLGYGRYYTKDVIRMVPENICVVCLKFLSK